MDEFSRISHNLYSQRESGGEIVEIQNFGSDLTGIVIKSEGMVGVEYIYGGLEDDSIVKIMGELCTYKFFTPQIASNPGNLFYHQLIVGDHIFESRISESDLKRITYENQQFLKDFEESVEKNYSKKRG